MERPEDHTIRAKRSHRSSSESYLCNWFLRRYAIFYRKWRTWRSLNDFCWGRELAWTNQGYKARRFARGLLGKLTPRQLPGNLASKGRRNIRSGGSTIRICLLLLSHLTSISVYKLCLSLEVSKSGDQFITRKLSKLGRIHTKWMRGPQIIAE